MISSLFSSFDPCSSFFISSWWSTNLIFLLLPSFYWVSSNRGSKLSSSLLHKLHTELSLLIRRNSSNITLTFLAIITLLIANNFIGLYPYIFTSTSHLVIALSLAAPLWVTFISYGWIKYTSYIFAHLVPLSTPSLLIPFIVLIESISNIIRPGTLTVRLSANIIAGHLLLTLLGSQTSYITSSVILSILLALQIILLTLEAAVALIQAYVFTVLSSLYSNEILPH